MPTWKTFDHLPDHARDPYPHIQVGAVVRHVGSTEEYVVTELRIEAGYPSRTLSCIAERPGHRVNIINIVNWELRV